MHFNAFTVPDIPLAEAGDDLAEIICKNARRVTRLAAIEPSGRAIAIAERNESDSRFVQAVLDESEEILLESPFLLVKTGGGNICVNAGIDGSNIDSGRIILLPEDSDRSAKNIRESIFSMTDKTVSVIITDTNGRAFRDGQIGVAIGISGIAPTKDWRGSCDLFGNVLEVAKTRRSWTRSLPLQTCSSARGLTARRSL